MKRLRKTCSPLKDKIVFELAVIEEMVKKIADPEILFNDGWLNTHFESRSLKEFS